MQREGDAFPKQKRLWVYKKLSKRAFFLASITPDIEYCTVF